MKTTTAGDRADGRSHEVVDREARLPSMEISGIDHVYMETRSWDDTVQGWESLGFSFVTTWGEDGHRAGSMVAGAATIVLAEVGAAETPAFTLHSSVDELASTNERQQSAPHFVTTTPPEATHWGTMLVRFEDGDGRVYVVETKSETT